MMEKSKARIKISLVLNIIISILTAIGFFIAFSGIKFSKGIEPVLEESKMGMFKFFTVDSNLFMGIVALIFALCEIKILKDNRKSISSRLYKLKFMATIGVFLTFAVVFIYLGPVSPGGINSMLMNSNLFFHLFIPVLSIINFMFIERCNKINFKDTLLGLVPMALYSIYYVTNVVIHIENGTVSPKYDFYWFIQDGLHLAFIVPPIIALLTYILSVITWRVNRVNK